MDDEIKRVTITLRELRQFERDSAMLSALKNAGVENWHGWDDAIEEFEENYDKDDES